MAKCDDFDSLSDGDKIGCLRDMVTDLDKQIKNVNTSAENLNSTIGSSGNIFKNMADTVHGMIGRQVEFAKSFSQQYKLGERIAQSYKKTSLQIGLSVSRSKDLSTQFKGAVANVAKFGGELSDVEGIYSDFADSSGRSRILGKEEVENIFKLSKATNLYGSEATNLYETLDLIGLSNVDATARMTELIIDSQKVGLNSSKVVKVLAGSMKSMQSYSFKEGVKGMTEMAKLGVKLRMDVSSMLGMAEKFYEPEAAIEAVANLQLLGGDVAAAFGDPFEIMYLARNKPEELAQKLQDMTENMLTLNEKTGEYEISAEQRMTLKAAGDQLGINVDQMVEMTRQTSKMKDVKDQLSMSSGFNEDEMDSIASMAKMQDGEFKIDVRDGNGGMMAKSIDDLTKGDLKMMVVAPKDEKTYQGDMLYNSQTTNEHLQNIEDAFQKGFISDVVDAYQVTENVTKEPIKSTERLFNDMKTSAMKQGSKYLEMFFKDMTGSVEEWSVSTGDVIAKFIDEKLNIFGEGNTLDMTTLEIGDIGTLLINGADHTVSDIPTNNGADHTVSDITPVESVPPTGSEPTAQFMPPWISPNGKTEPITINPITMTINGDLSLSNNGTTTGLKLDLESVKKVVSTLIENALNGTTYAGGVPGNTLQTSEYGDGTT